LPSSPLPKQAEPNRCTHRRSSHPRPHTIHLDSRPVAFSRLPKRVLFHTKRLNSQGKNPPRIFHPLGRDFNYLRRILCPCVELHRPRRHRSIRASRPLRLARLNRAQRFQLSARLETSFYQTLTPVGHCIYVRRREVLRPIAAQ
jgi:hypothetical protein